LDLDFFEDLLDFDLDFFDSFTWFQAETRTHFFHPDPPSIEDEDEDEDEDEELEPMELLPLLPLLSLTATGVKTCHFFCPKAAAVRIERSPTDPGPGVQVNFIGRVLSAGLLCVMVDSGKSFMN